MPNPSVSSGNPTKRFAASVPALFAVLMLAACGGSGAPTTPTSQAKNRAFISNAFAGVLQIVDSQNDTTPMTAQTTNSAGQLVPGQPVTITVSTHVTFEVESPDHATTMVYDPNTNVFWFVDNATEATTGNVGLASATSMAVFSPDNSKVYVPEPNKSFSGLRSGGVEVITRSSASVTAAYNIPSARYVALSPNGDVLLVFADNSDSVFLLDLTASTVTPVEIPGFARPINAFFSSDSNTAYVLNCGPECGYSNPASVF